MACDYCAYRYSYDCDDGWNQHKIVKVLSWIGIVYLIKIRKLFRRF